MKYAVGDIFKVIGDPHWDQLCFKFGAVQLHIGDRIVITNVEEFFTEQYDSNDYLYGASLWGENFFIRGGYLDNFEKV